MSETYLKTYQFRIKDAKTRKKLTKMASSVNFAWNYINELCDRAYKERKLFLSAYDLHRYTKHSSTELGLHSQTIQTIGEYHYRCRNTIGRRRLKWRTAKRKLGWIPFKSSAIRCLSKGVIKYNKQYFRFWESRPIEGKVKCGSFNQDSEGKWYVNITCELPLEKPTSNTQEVGIDLGITHLATLSSGEKIENPRAYKKLEAKLARAQRAKKKKQVKRIHAKIKNTRKDYLHKESTKLVKRFGKIFIGDVNVSALAKSKLAKSVTDSGWGLFKLMLEYKSLKLGVGYEVSNEKYSSVTCSACQKKTGPSGLSALEVRKWECSNCGTSQDRDINAARNILQWATVTSSPKKSHFPSGASEAVRGIPVL